MGMYAIIILEINFNASMAHTKKDHFYESNKKKIEPSSLSSDKIYELSIPKRTEELKKKSIIDGHFSLL